MRARIATTLGVIMCVLACSGREQGDANADAMGDAEPNDSTLDTTAIPPDSSSGETPLDANDGAGEDGEVSVAGCLTGPLDKTSDGFTYNVQATCDADVGGECVSTLTLHSDCSVDYQDSPGSVTRSTTVPDPDCSNYKSWLGGLARGSSFSPTSPEWAACGAAPGAKTETLAVDLGAEGVKTIAPNSCAVEPYSSLRACLAAFQSKYIPPKK